MKQLAGTYTNLRQTAELYVEEGKLFLKVRSSSSNAPARELVRLDQDSLTYGSRSSTEDSASPNRVTIVRDSNGNPEYLCLSGRALRRQSEAESSK